MFNSKLQLLVFLFIAQKILQYAEQKGMEYMTRQTSVRQFELKEKILSSQDKRTKIEQLRQIRTNIEQLRQIRTNIEYVGQKDKNSVIRTEGTNNVEYTQVRKNQQ